MSSTSNTKLRLAGWIAVAVGVVQLIFGGSGLTFAHQIQDMIEPGFLLILAASGVALVFFGWKLKKGENPRQALRVMIPLAVIPVIISLFRGAFTSLGIYGVLSIALIQAWRALPNEQEDVTATEPPEEGAQDGTDDASPKAKSRSSSAPSVSPYRKTKSKSEPDVEAASGSNEVVSNATSKPGSAATPTLFGLVLYFFGSFIVIVLAVALIAVNHEESTTGQNYTQQPQTYSDDSGQERDSFESGSSSTSTEEAGPLPFEVAQQGWEAYEAGDYERAYHKFRDAAEDGNGYAQLHVGAMFQDGVFVQQSNERAAAWYEQAVESGHPHAGYFLGNMYGSGYGVSRDGERAFDLYLQAAREEFAPAMFEVATMYRLGIGATRNVDEALGWYFNAGEAGHARSQTMLGKFYLNGTNGLRVDLAEAEKWFRKAANLDHPEAQYYMGVMYENGYAVERSSFRASIWYRIASRRDYGEASAGLLRVNVFLSNDERAQAQRLAREWEPSE